MTRLVLEDLRKSFGGLAAVDGFDLTLSQGELHALVGPNGCGKSTLFNLITGALKPDSGRIQWDGRDITGLQPATVARLGIGRKFQVPSVFEQLTVAENLALPGWAGHPLPMWRRARLEEDGALIDLIRLGASAGRTAASLSHGQRQWLEIGMLLASRARLLLLDEPTAGMTEAETAETAALIRRIAGDHETTVLVIEHDVAFIRQLDCPVTVMAKGKVLRSGSYAAIRADAEVRELYFGQPAASC
jgi:urea transport system ATP-binding protein